jgi:HSP20 family protein
MASNNLTSARSGGLMANPFQLLQREMNRLFEDVFHSDFAQPRPSGNTDPTMLMPRMEVRDTEKELHVIAELPGVTEKDVDVALDDDVLTIRGEKKFEREEKHENMHFTERSYGTFQRSLRLPYRVEPNQVKATFENGVLTVSMPKNPAREQARKIPVQGTTKH